MKKKKIGIILICMLFIAAPALSAAGIMNNDKSIKETSDEYSDLVHQIISGSSISGYWLEQDKLVASDGAAWDWFGGSVSIDGDYALIGATGGGSAYIFKRSSTIWTEKQKLSVAMFCGSVSIDGDYALIGAPVDDGQKGSAYIFKRNGTTWAEEAKLTASDGASGDDFGWSVSIDGDYALIGAIWDDDLGSDSGSAYVFKCSGTSWSQEAKLTASDGAAFDYFGWSVSIDGDYALIGAEGGKDSAYVFKRSGTNWTQQAKLAPSGGRSVSIDGNYALIGTGGGSAYVFKRSGTNWTQQAKLTASGDNFGFSVSIDGDYALIGAPGDYCGSAYVFKRSGTAWTEEQKLTTSDGEDHDCFGGSVSIDGDYALIGADGDDGNKGSAYVFKRNPPPNAPTITGPTSGKVRVEYQYNFSLSDPDDDSMYLRVDWGNGTPGPWHGPYDSDTTVKLNHTWNKKGTFTIRAQAKDIYDCESEWDYLEVTMPKNKPSNFNFYLLSWLFEKFPHVFLILGYLLGL